MQQVNWRMQDLSWEWILRRLKMPRLLSPREYTYNDKLGYISLNTALNTDEILAVAYEYTYRGQTSRWVNCHSPVGSVPLRP